jgi:hypothetical protein
LVEAASQRTSCTAKPYRENQQRASQKQPFTHTHPAGKSTNRRPVGANDVESRSHVSPHELQNIRARRLGVGLLARIIQVDIFDETECDRYSLVIEIMCTLADLFGRKHGHVIFNIIIKYSVGSF